MKGRTSTFKSLANTTLSNRTVGGAYAEET